MISRAPAISGTTPSPGYRASSTDGKLAEQGPPIEVASGERARHRLSRAGDRQLNHALHLIALVQARSPGCAGYRYVHGKLAEGKTHREAMRCLKRRIADHVWRVMLADEQPASTPNPKPFDTQRRPRSSLSTGRRLLLLPVSSEGGLVEP